MQKSNGLFTTRQAAVIDALRQGKPNKIIAYELKMRESTVKVHVRNIMKKLNATNRTQVAYLVTQLSDEWSLLVRVPKPRCSRTRSAPESKALGVRGRSRHRQASMSAMGQKRTS